MENSINQNIFLQNSLQRLIKFLKEPQGLAIAYSGGMDSGFLALLSVLSRRSINTLAYLVKTEFMSNYEYNKALKLANKYNIPVQVISLELLNNQDIVKNSVLRCYFCKKFIYNLLLQKIPPNWQLIDGSVLDDENDYRPGKQALLEMKIISPMVMFGITKNMINDYLQQISAHDFIQPSNSCLATRIPYNFEISLPKLSQIEKAEMFLLERGFYQVRVRHHNDLARIEVDKKQIKLLLEKADEISAFIKQLGFKYVTIDIDGYRKGSMNL